MSVPVSPLFSVTKRPVATNKPKLTSDALTPSTKSQEVPHSGHQSEQSQHYHAKIVGTNTERAVSKLNPAAEQTAHRMFPGLAN